MTTEPYTPTGQAAIHVAVASTILLAPVGRQEDGYVEDDAARGLSQAPD